MEINNEMGNEHRLGGAAGDDPRRRDHPVRLPRLTSAALLGNFLTSKSIFRRPATLFRL
jgi:hypothetical protein